jgi:hypothetical protein
MLKHLILAISVAVATPAFAHSDHKFTKGPHGGHIVDAGGGAQHWELVASGGELTLYVADKSEKAVDTAGGSAEAQVLLAGKSHKVALTPAGGNMLKGAGPFMAAKGMKVIVKTNKVGGSSFQARLTPLQ